MPKKTVDALIDMEYNSLVQLSRSENKEMLQSVVSQMVKVANRRINNLNKSEIGQFSPALKIAPKEGKFTTRGLKTASTNELMHQYSQLKKFLKAKSSTVSGWQAIRKGIRERTGAKKLFQSEYKSQRSAAIWHNREKRFWNLYNKLVDNYGGIITQLDSDRIQQMLMKVQTMKGTKKSDDDISEMMNKYITDLYEAANKGENINDEQWVEEVRILYSK